MPLPDSASQARLAAIGIELWRRRTPSGQSVAAGARGSEPRVRLASGAGAWLLVQRHPWDGSQATLVGDITALLGTGQCCFGQWSSSASAGLAVSELAARGIDRIVAFGPLPGQCEVSGMMIQAAALDELAHSARARRRLWEALRPALRR